MSEGSIMGDFQKEIESVIDKYRDLTTFGELIGALEIIKLNLFDEMIDPDKNGEVI